jgi:predicted transcriptional regulator of viral defense system
MQTTLEKASPKIFEALAERPIWTHSDLQALLRDKKEDWGLPGTLSFNKFIQFAIEHGQLQRHRFEFPHRPATRYSWGAVSLESILQSIHPKGYFSHYTAMQHHDLTEQIPKTIYFNIEQKLTGGGTKPSQTAMDRAFQGKCRVSQNSVNLGERTIRILNGRNTGEMGVITILSDHPIDKRITDIERTLIDITVRPIYSGGVFQVAEAFAAAASKMSVEKLTTYLRNLNFTYPYHQSIGYYMERSGKYSRSQLNTLRELGVDYDFYLDYGMKKTNFVSEWRLHVPQGF